MHRSHHRRSQKPETGAFKCCTVNTLKRLNNKERKGSPLDCHCTVRSRSITYWPEIMRMIELSFYRTDFFYLTVGKKERIRQRRVQQQQQQQQKHRFRVQSQGRFALLVRCCSWCASLTKKERKGGEQCSSGATTTTTTTTTTATWDAAAGTAGATILS